MNYKILKKLPSKEDLVARFPLSPQGAQGIQQHRQEIKNILTGQDPRLLLVVGPCSAWPRHSVLQYAGQLLEISRQVEDVLKIVIRVYTQKPRTQKGWSGIINQPNPFEPPNIEAGLYFARHLMVSVVEMGLAIADEALFVNNAPGFVELLSWMAIGARSSENPEHRIFASGLDCAVGIKNPTHGCLKTGVNSVVVAQQEHTAAFEGHAIKTFGNPYAHIVLRGSQKGPNYHSLHEVEKLLFKEKVQYPALLVDASHDNSLLNGKKDAAQQPTVIFQTLDFVKHQPGLQKLLKGFMVESFLQDGHQNLQECLLQGRAPLDGLSVTDPCLGFDKTKKLIFKLAKRLKKI